MKYKYLIKLSIIFVLFTSVILLIQKEKSKNFDEALGVENKIQVIAEDKTDKGSVVFCYSEEENIFYTSFLRKKIFGYEEAYSGVSTDIKEVAETFGFSYTAFPPIKKTSLPIYFGVIGDDKIKEIRIKESSSEDGWENVKIIEAEDMRIWLMYMENFKGSNFDLVGIDNQGKEIVNISDDIRPWSVDQKPFKGY